MKRTVTGLCVAAAFGFVATLGAQSATQSTTPQSGTSTTVGTTGTAGTTEQQNRNDMRNDAHDMTLTGCLARDASGNFTLNNATMGSGSSAATTSGASAATTTGGSNAGTATGTTEQSHGNAASGRTATGTTESGNAGATGTTYNDANRSASGSMATSWALEGAKSELEKHVGHKVQVTGSMAMDHGSASTAASGRTETSSAGVATGTTGSTGSTGSTAAAGQSEHGKMEHRLDVKSVKMISGSCQ